MDKYYHIAIWVYLNISKLCEKCKKKDPKDVKEKQDEEHAKNFNLLKPLSRFYHLINLSGVVIMWLIVNLVIAVLVKYQHANENISASNFIIGVIVSTLAGHILIMLVTKLLHVLYMKNIEDAFTEKELEIKLKQKNLQSDTQRSENIPMLKNEYNIDSEKFETKLSINRWEETSRASSQRPDTARNMIKSSRPDSASSKDAKVAPSNYLAQDHNPGTTPLISETDGIKPRVIQRDYLGDTEVLTDESKKFNNSLNTVIFMIMLGFIAFLIFFC